VLALVGKGPKMSDVKKSGWAMASMVVLVIDVFGLTLLAITTAATRIKIAELYQDMGAAKGRPWLHFRARGDNGQMKGRTSR